MLYKSNTNNFNNIFKPPASNKDDYKKYLYMLEKQSGTVDMRF